MRRGILFLLIGLVFLGGCDMGGQSSQLQWQEFTSEDGGFSVLMPGKPEEETLRQESEGVEIASDMYRVQADNVSYMVLITPLQEEALALDPAEFFDQYRDNILESTKAELKEEKEITLDGNPGRELSLNQPSEVGRQRMYLVDNLLYQTVIGGPEQKVTRDATKFLDSFKLLGR